jgi:integrase
LPKPLRRKPAGRTVTRRLKDGTSKTYHYGPWKPPPTAPAGDTMRGLLRAFEASPEFAAKASATQTQYLIYLKPWLRVADTPPREVTRREILGARDVISRTRGIGAATAFGRITALLFAWALDRGWVDFNPAARLKALPRGELPAWDERHITQAMAALPEHLRRVAVLALHTGQRRGDLCAMTWAAYDGATIRLRQSKTGAALVIPAHPNLQAELERWKADGRDAVQILLNARGEPWKPQHLSHMMDEALEKIGLPGRLNVHGLRKAAARRLAEAGCTIHEIAAITGHQTLAMVQHYTASANQEKLAGAAIAKLQRPTNRQKR